MKEATKWNRHTPEPVYACIEMLSMCGLYASFESKVRPRSFGCLTMCSAVLLIWRSRLPLYSSGSGVNRVLVVLSRQKLYVGMIVCISWCTSVCRCDGDSSAYAMT